MGSEQRQGRRLRCVVFCLGERYHAFPLEHVVEAVRMVALTEIPGSPSWLLGAMNLRGRIIPVVDLRVRLGLPAPEPDLRTPILVVDAADRMCAFVVDDVLAVELLSIGIPAETQPEQAHGESSVVAGVAASEDRLIVVLEAEHLTAGSEQLLSVSAR